MVQNCEIHIIFTRGECSAVVSKVAGTDVMGVAWVGELLQRINTVYG